MSEFDEEAFGRRLRLARLALGLNETEAANAAGVRVETWRKYEATGRGYVTGPIRRFVNNVDADKRRRILSLDWLVAGEGRPPLRLISGNCDAA